MRRRAITWFTVETETGSGLYRTRTHAMSTARWIARQSGRPVTVKSEASGAMWRVSPPA